MMFPIILLVIGISGLTSPVQAVLSQANDDIYEYYETDAEPSLTDIIDETIDWILDLFDEPDECIPNPCENNGVCETLKSGGFKCICAEPYIGKKCQDERNVCQNVNCHNGLCVITQKPPFHECKCYPPFNGPSCKKPSACVPSPCLNGGTCVKGRTRSSFKCECPGNYTGRFCQVGLNDCYEGNGESYRGFVSETVEELECLPWNYHRIAVKNLVELNDGIGPHNYCRNPDGEPQPWCFVRQKGKMRWDFCNVNPCTKEALTVPVKPTMAPTKLEFSSCGETSLFSMVSPRIFGGRKSLPNAHPWQASLQYRPLGSNETFRHGCGGTLIDSCWLVTAAHCIDKNEEIRVELGSSNLEKNDPAKQFLEVEKAFVHENYTETDEALYNDIALLKLKAKNGHCALETNSVRAACLTRDSFPDGTKCTISGYGVTEKNDTASPQLLDAKILLIPQRRCMSRNMYGTRMDDSMMCAGYLEGKIDSCQGDSGGPLICKKDETHYLHGVVSWGDRCGMKNKPGVYARVNKFIDWLRETMV
ncbi:hyaluronan-binding protein 2 [Triplophysa dalaica]|uniref:hyaluronan-binding protein 2 n=1 Tax=Triplophysa dalaica TaxID=1582913 RepID=UPI0024DFF1B2|nr:hyaluronan-binding protein 2 [Triplophysa dalaica]